ncbi:uncharacterized protein LOC120287254 [Eucalyptus grandis]|uniref:uncharacterized protein LOC120287254 n=1 Tax=Eucalyptus grandis TaxID=71139 RepID=UPI00192E7FFE|nr:uncharacterized protein LOC120287254 [Eucalyptus grandis]
MVTKTTPQDSHSNSFVTVAMETGCDAAFETLVLKSLVPSPPSISDGAPSPPSSTRPGHHLLRRIEVEESAYPELWVWHQQLLNQLAVSSLGNPDAVVLFSLCGN